MRIVLICVGRLKSGPEQELLDRYCERLTAIGRVCGIHGLDIREIDESRARRPQDRCEDEAQAIAAAFPRGAVSCAFDERGGLVSSADFAKHLARVRDSGAAATFIIGGPDGLSEGCRTSVDRLISFGAMTLPHQLVRVLVAEQLYRAATLLTGHPYHRS